MLNDMWSVEVGIDNPDQDSDFHGPFNGWEADEFVKEVTEVWAAQPPEAFTYGRPFVVRRKLLSDSNHPFYSRAARAAANWYADEESLDSHSKYQMFSPEGNAAVHELVLHVQDKMKNGTLTPRTVIRYTEDLRDEVGDKYPEITDTEPRNAIWDQLDTTCDELGWKEIEELKQL